ncbi:MAG TPA: FAD-dependent oxidoreductase [Ignavibacteria bacterium]|nr:FAD-dependent oxidoreductase [Ignavibacteria bacterium]
MVKRIIILGSGFSAFRYLKKIDKEIFKVTAVSPRNHFLFTPLLPSTTVGSIEFRSIIEPIRRIDNIEFIQASCINIDSVNNKILCEGSTSKDKFELTFDILIIAVGETSHSFNIKGINENALYLKELADARKIRTRVIDCFENANLPDVSEEKRNRFLTFVVCGGGPTGVEFAAELHDFIEEDVKKKYPHLAEFASIYLVEGRDSILSDFDKKLGEYTLNLFKRQNINLLTKKPVTEVDNNFIYLCDGTSLKYGLLVWAAGNTSVQLVKHSGFPLNNNGKIITDKYLNVKGYENIYAIGDCSAIENYALPATAQVAQKQGLYLAGQMNDLPEKRKPFVFKNLGMLTYVGGHKALADLPSYKGSGFAAYLFWKSVYLTRLVSLKNKILVLFDWIKTSLFGRDVSNF